MLSAQRGAKGWCFRPERKWLLVWMMGLLRERYMWGVLIRACVVSVPCKSAVLAWAMRCDTLPMMIWQAVVLVPSTDCLFSGLYLIRNLCPQSLIGSLEVGTALFSLWGCLQQTFEKKVTCKESQCCLLHSSLVYLPNPIVLRKLTHPQHTSNVSHQCPSVISEVNGPCGLSSSQLRLTPLPSVRLQPLW